MSNLKIPNEVWCRTCGYYRPVAQMSKGKRAEFEDRVNYKLPEVLAPEEARQPELLNHRCE